MIKSNFLIIILISISLFFIFLPYFKADSNLEYDFCLKKSYDYYRQNFMSKDGRIIDPDKNYITTSEGQSYMLLRSLIINDRKTFDLIYKWAKDNLQRSDKLFAWLWGENSKGEYKILEDNSAADADVDIAFALILAYERWGNSKYLEEAKPIVNSIWNNETRKIDGSLILMPGVVQTQEEKIEVNPSYFSPYAFKYFQKYDNMHDWNLLTDSSYRYLNAVMEKTATGLPPNWFFIENGQIVLEDSPRSDFSYDAIRVFTRIYLDYVRTGDKRALPILDKSKFFIEQWKKTKNFYVNYEANGQLRNKDKFIGSIGALIPVISMYDPQVASEIYDEEARPYFNSKKYWEARHDYYAKNLLWFGCYFYNKNSNEYKEMHKRRLRAE